MRSAVIWAIRFYRLAISPLKPPCCRFIPTCSEYALEAVGRFGVLRGGLLALWRLLRCHPFARGGYDPVPLQTGRARGRPFSRPPADAPTPIDGI
jgi:uncharacterized protein